MKSARRAPDRRRDCVFQSQGLYFSRFRGNRGRWWGETRDLERFYSTQVWRKETERQIACDMVGPDSTMVITDHYHGFRYCVPMDGHRPWLDLRFYKDICPDQNGASSRIAISVFNEILSKFPLLQCSPNMTSSGATSKWMCPITPINILIAMCLKWRKTIFENTTCVPLAMMLDMCD